MARNLTEAKIQLKTRLRYDLSFIRLSDFQIFDCDLGEARIEETIDSRCTCTPFFPHLGSILRATHSDRLEGSKHDAGCDWQVSTEKFSAISEAC